MGVHSKRAAVYKPGRKLSPKSDPADALMLDFLPLPASFLPLSHQNQFLMFNHSVYSIWLWQHQ